MHRPDFEDVTTTPRAVPPMAYGHDPDVARARTIVRVSLAIILAGIALAAGLALCGCGSSALGAHARAASVTIATVQTVGVTVDEARTLELDMAEEAHPWRGPERDATLTATAARWEPAGAALDALRDALIAWVDAIELAAAADAGEDVEPHLLTLAGRVVLLYDSVGRAIRAARPETRVPELPAIVRALARGAAGGR